MVASCTWRFADTALLIALRAAAHHTATAQVRVSCLPFERVIQPSRQRRSPVLHLTSYCVLGSGRQLPSNRSRHYFEGAEQLALLRSRRLHKAENVRFCTWTELRCQAETGRWQRTSRWPTDFCAVSLFYRQHTACAILTFSGCDARPTELLEQSTRHRCRVLSDLLLGGPATRRKWTSNACLAFSVVLRTLSQCKILADIDLAWL